MNGLKNVRSRREDALSRVGWDRLEVLMADYYRGQGYQVEHVGTGSSGGRFDGGIDLKLRREGQYLVVQCKHWNAKQVPHNVVHELLGIMVSEGASGAILATSGEFTRYARDSAAKSGHVQLIDGDALRATLGPLPELAEAPTSPALTSLASGIAGEVGERLLRATEDRIRYGGGGRPARRKPAKDPLIAMLWQVGLFLLFAWFIVVVMGGALKRALSSIATPPQPHARLVTDPPPTRPAAPTAVQVVAPARASNPCHELIDKPSGTYIDHCAKAVPPKPTTAAEIRESQRKADEAAAILTPNTPEM